MRKLAYYILNYDASKGISLVELLLCVAIFSICILFILQIISVMFSNMVEARMHCFGAVLVNEKIEYYRAVQFSDIVAGDFYDKPHFLVTRRWSVEEWPVGYYICVFSYTNAGFPLYQFCTQRTGYE